MLPLFFFLFLNIILTSIVWLSFTEFLSLAETTWQTASCGEYGFHSSTRSQYCKLSLDYSPHEHGWGCFLLFMPRTKILIDLSILNIKNDCYTVIESVSDYENCEFLFLYGLIPIITIIKYNLMHNTIHSLI